MNMKKWIISVATLTLTLSAAGAGTAFALSGDDGNDNSEILDGTGTTGPVSDGVPTYDEWLDDKEAGEVVTSIDDIDPNVCNLIHNINACRRWSAK